MVRVVPKLTLLDLENINVIHDHTLSVLSKVGIRVDSKAAINIFSKSDGCIIEDNLVKILPELVEWAIGVSPSSIEIFNRIGGKSILLESTGNNRTHFGIGVTNLYFQDPISEQVSPFTRQHMETSVRLGNYLPNIEFVSTIGVIQDVLPSIGDLVSTLEMIANTTKPLILLVSDPRQYNLVLDLIEELCIGLDKSCFILPYFNPISPLVLNKSTAENIISTVQRGLPLIYSNFGMAGATTPITEAGTLITLNAELLAGLVFCQLLQAGTPVVLGSLPASFDIKTMRSFYSPTTFLLNLACAELMTYYGIPHCGTSGSDGGWSADLIASGELWLNHLSSLIGKVGLVPFIGSIHNSLCFSPTLAVYADQVIEKCKHFSRGFTIDPDMIALDEILETGPGGNFLMTETTLMNFRSTLQRDLFPKLDIKEWISQQKPNCDQILQKYTSELLEHISAPEDHDELIEKGRKFIAELQ
ncbi:MAG: trimethylamine methyltransferase family protein [Anaerolineaceae bacterium]|nr:trimethylamine methyltransferase family protein [Anaerolineaceae bacterium]